MDTPRCVPGAVEHILAQLATCGLHPDAPPLWQSQRGTQYQAALARLQAAGWAYPCACTRKEIEAAWAAQGLVHERHVERPYPGTCRTGLRGRSARAWRFHTAAYQKKVAQALTQQAQAAPFYIADDHLHWHDRRLGAQQQNVAHSVGDFVLRRADGLWAYQLAVVVDDAAQGITHIVRGKDLADNTPRQIVLQRALGLPTPHYLHTPLVLGDNGEKLSKQSGALPLPEGHAQDSIRNLQAAARVLGLPEARATTPQQALAQWVPAWQQRWMR